jgi:hypothetical protein
VTFGCSFSLDRGGGERISASRRVEVRAAAEVSRLEINFVGGGGGNGSMMTPFAPESNFPFSRRRNERNERCFCFAVVASKGEEATRGVIGRECSLKRK